MHDTTTGAAVAPVANRDERKQTMDIQTFNELTQGQDADSPRTRRGVFGLLASALIAAGFVGAQSAEARRRGGNNNGRGGRGGRGGNGRGGNGRGGNGNGRGGRRNNH
jgi:hypothetical protein